MNHNKKEGELPRSSQTPFEDEMGEIRSALSGLRFGSVQILVQDGIIVQIDRTEKRRLKRPSSR
jgi:hypothetical protein